MAVRTSWTAGDVLTAADLTDTFGAKANSSALSTAGGLVAVAPTSIANSGGSASLSGNTVSFSGVSSVSLNGCFSATYDNYRVLVNLNSPSANNNWLLRLRSSGTDATSGNYTTMLIGRSAASATVDLTAANASAAYLNQMGSGVSGHAYSVDLTMQSPNLAAFTTMNVLSTGTDTGTTFRAYSGGVIHNVASSYDGFTTYLDGGNISGTLSVYGFKK